MGEGLKRAFAAAKATQGAAAIRLTAPQAAMLREMVRDQHGQNNGLGLTTLGRGNSKVAEALEGFGLAIKSGWQRSLATQAGHAWVAAHPLAENK